ncbi:hypothetical protein [Streptomyces sp. FH025]|uniref:hypothetical protein n=1 Tax=Streptomyces sp. FH025 TaxID=2815937 RepID=UPI001A9FEB2C|nr:hypothetical protein [Streptomyces sp. FH025]MBO1413470.1 hypothetical protein [Streptomyces sp. FH025]
MRIRPIMLIAATVTAAAIATAGGMATAATGTSTPTPTAHGKPSGAPTATAHGSSSPVTRATATPAAFTVTSTATAPIEAGAVAEILASCLGADASRYHAVIAVRAPVASSDTDGVVIAVNSADQYVQCESKGHKGTSMSVPPTFINDRLWGTGHLIEYFDSFSAPAGAGQFLSLGAGHYTPEVAKVTISYGDDPTQYPAVMAGGAFAYTAAISTGHNGNSVPPAPYVHAYDADGKEIYNQKTQPTVKGARQ